MTPATHLIATLAMTGAAVLAAFALPVPAHAVSMTIVTGDSDGVAVVGSGTAVDVKRAVGAFAKLRIDGPLDVDAQSGAAPG
jgi:hypothetical protein